MISGLTASLVLAAGLTGAASPASSVFEHPATAAGLAQTLAPLTGTLRDTQTLRGAFTQRKTLKELPRPLVAQGTFLFVRERGILWRTTAPFTSELVITRDALLQRDSGDTPGQRLLANSNPAVRQVSEIFMAMFGLDYAALERIFALYGERRKTRWALGLRPREQATASAMQDIVLEGAAQVSRVTLRDTQGDVTEITLHDTIASREAPTTEEQKLFSQ